MTGRRPLLGAIAVCAAAFGLQGCAPAEAATFHVNYDRGSDDADGSAVSPWKHAPGDPKAAGRVAKTLLRPGDTVRFAAGIRYRGAIVVSESGTANAPIVFEGAEGAVIDGSDLAASVAPCGRAEDCAGSPIWSQLVRIQLPYPVTPDAGLFVERGSLRPAQWPDPKDDFYRDEIEDMAAVDGKMLEQGRLPLPREVAAGLRSDGARLALWVVGNRVEYRPLLGVEGNEGRFDASGLKFYTDRPDRAAIIGHPAVIDRPGEYALLGDGKTVIAMLPHGARAVSLASGRHGLRLRNASHVVIRGLTFERFGDGGQKPPAGLAIFADGQKAGGLRIENNRFRHFVMPKGQGAITTRGISDLAIRGNAIEDIVLGAGMQLAGPAQRYLIEGNTINRIGGTAIALLNIDQALVSRNRITDVRGVHGNGLTAYLDNRDIRFVANTVLDAKRPATFHGGPDTSRPNNIVFENNLLVATPDALGVLFSWGRATRGVRIRRNVLQGGTAGLRLHDSDSDVEVQHNISNGLLISGAQPSNWRVEGNVWTSLTWQQQRLSPRPKVTSGLSNAAKMLVQGRAPPEICAVILRGAGATNEGADAVGAEVSCSP